MSVCLVDRSGAFWGLWVVAQIVHKLLKLIIQNHSFITCPLLCFQTAPTSAMTAKRTHFFIVHSLFCHLFIYCSFNHMQQGVLVSSCVYCLFIYLFLSVFIIF